MADKRTILNPKTRNAKYQEAVSLYATPRMTYKQIAESCGVGVSAFRIYLRRCHRESVLARYGVRVGVKDPSQICLHAQGQQPSASYRKYNVSQIAHHFNLDGTTLNNQLKLHYPEILERREKAWARFGLNDCYLHKHHPQLIARVAEQHTKKENNNNNLKTSKYD